MECFPLTELVTETERKPSLVDDAYARAKGRHSLVGVRPKPRDSLANEHYSAFAIVILTVHCPYGRFRSSRNTNSRPPRSFMKRHFLTLGWTSILNSPPAVLICGLFATIAAAHAQIRTVTQQPYWKRRNSAPCPKRGVSGRLQRFPPLPKAGPDDAATGSPSDRYLSAPESHRHFPGCGRG